MNSLFWNTVAVGLQCFLFLQNVESYVQKYLPDFYWLKTVKTVSAVCTKNILTHSMSNMLPSHRCAPILFLGSLSGRFLASHVSLVNLHYLIS